MHLFSKGIKPQPLQAQHRWFLMKTLSVSEGVEEGYSKEHT